MTSPLDMRGVISFETAGAAASVDGVTKATAALAASTKEASAKAFDAAIATANFGTTAKTAQVSVGQFGSTVGLAGQAVNKLNPALGGLVTMAGSSLGAIQSLTTAGMGPLGIAMAALSLTVSAGTTLWGLYADEVAGVGAHAVDAAKQLALLARASQTTNAVLGAANLAEMEAEEQRLSLKIRGLEFLDDNEVNDRQRDATQTTRRELRERIELYRNHAAAEETLANRAARAAEEAEAAAGRPARGRSGGGRTASSGDSNDANKDAANKAAEQAAMAAEMARATEEALTDELQKGLDARAEAQRIANENLVADEEMKVEKVRRAIDRENEAREKSAKIMADIQSATMGAMNLVTSAVDAGLEGSRKSEKEKTKIKAQAALIQSIIGAALETAQAVAAYASFNIPQGIAHTLAAGMYVVAGVKAGAAAGGGGASASVPSTSGAGAGPMSTADGGGGKGGNVYNINWGSSALVYAADREQLGNTLIDAIDSASARRAA